MGKLLFKNKTRLLFVLILIPISTLLSTLFALSFKGVIDASVVNDMNQFVRNCLICISLCVLDFTFSFLSRYWRNNLIKLFRFDLKKKIFNHILSENNHILEKKNSGYYISKITNDINILEESYIKSIFGLYIAFWGFCFSFFTVFMIHSTLSIIILLLSILMVFIPNLLEKKLITAKTNYSKSNEKYISWIKECFESIELIKNFMIERSIKNKHEDVAKNVEKNKFASDMFMYIVNILSTLFGQVMYLVIFIFGGILVFKGQITVGLLLSLSQLIGGIAAPFSQIPQYIANMKSIKEIKKEVENLMSEKELDNGTYHLDEINSIKLNNVNLTINSRKILNEINFEFIKGKKYLIVGESGSGKSTLLKLLMKNVKPSEGNIQINHYELEEIKYSDYLNKICYSPQDTFIFEDTIRNNIELYKPNENIDLIVKQAGLEKFIDKLDLNIDTKISELGKNISSGEIQRIGLARALNRNSDVYLFDEITANLDQKTSQEIENNILDLCDKTVIMVSHKILKQSLNKIDKILIIENGKIIESANYEQLKENEKLFNKYFVNE